MFMTGLLVFTFFLAFAIGLGSFLSNSSDNDE